MNIVYNNRKCNQLCGVMYEQRGPIWGYLDDDAKMCYET